MVKKNVISIEALVSDDLMVMVDKKVLKVTKESMVIIKCVQIRNLYYLVGNTVMKNM